MGATLFPTRLVFGLAQKLPLSGFPDGDAEIIMEHNEFAIVQIKKDGQTRKFYPQVEDGKWIPFVELRRNQTP